MNKNNSPPGYLPNSTRRRILSVSAGALATGFAGCIGETNERKESTTDTESPNETISSKQTTSPPHELKSSPYDIETEEGPSSTTVSGNVVLEEGQYAQYEFELEEPTEVHITGSNEAEGPMDLLLLSPESELSTYMDGESTDFTGEFTETNIESVDRSFEASSGDYFLVFDNSAVYGAEPEGKVAFEFEMVLGDTSPSQPKISEVQDNFGNTFRFTQDAHDNVAVDDEIVVSDDTEVELCVTDVAKQADDNLVYNYGFGRSQSGHPDNADKIQNNCNLWDMQRSDYQSDWIFSISISNGDEIDYQNNEIDYRVSIRYTNLTLEE